MFNKYNFCHIASNNRNEQKGSVFIYKTQDPVATVTQNGYFNEKLIDINLHDLIIHIEIDQIGRTQNKNILIVTERTADNVNTRLIVDQTVKNDLAALDADSVKKSVTEMQSLSGPLTVKDEICLTDSDDNVAKHSLSIVAGVPTETATDMDIIGNRKYDTLPTTDDATTYADLNPKSMITKGQVASAISTKADTTTTDTLRNDVDGLGDQVQEIESKIPGDATASNQLATKADLAKKQDTLVSGTNIKTVNGESLLGSGDVKIESGGAGRNIGDIFYTTRTDTALAGAVECNGGTYSTADYTGDGSIGELLEAGKLDYISLTDYATAISTKGWCDKIGWDGTGTTSFRVPTLTPRIIQTNNIPVVGNGKNIGWTDGTNEYSGTGSTYQGVGLTGIFGNDVSKTLPATASYISYEPAHSKMYGVSTDPTKSGMIADTSDTAQLRVMFQLFNGTTDEAVATVGTVVAQVGELRNMSNITPTGKETVVGWGMPDYSAGIAKVWNTDISTTKNVRICYGGSSGNQVADSIRLHINNNLIGNYIIANSGFFMQWADIPAGVTYKVTGGQFDQYIIEYPFKGAN